MKTCHKCGGAFIWQHNQNGKWIPTDPRSGKPHWTTCGQHPKRRQRKRSKPAGVVAVMRLNRESEKRLQHLLETA